MEQEMDMATSGSHLKTIDDYIAEFPKNVRDSLEELRRVIRESAPDAEEAMRYGIPTFRLNGNLVHFAAFKNHIGFYPTPSAITAFNKELSAYKQEKGSVQFPLDIPIPYELVGKIFRYRVEESLGSGKKER